MASMHGHLVLPLKLVPHRTVLGISHRCWLDVIDYIDANVVQNDAMLVRGSAARQIVHKVAVDHTCVGGGHLEVRPDPNPVHGTDGVRLVLPVTKLEVTKGRQLQADILQSVLGAVHYQHIQDNVISVHIDVALGIQRIGEASQLGDASQGTSLVGNVVVGSRDVVQLSISRDYMVVSVWLEKENKETKK